MGIFSVVKNTFTNVIGWAGEVVDTAATAVVNTAKTVFTAVVDTVTTAATATLETGQREVQDVVGKTVDTVDKAVGDTVDYATKTADAIIGGSVSTAGAAVSTVVEALNNAQEVGTDLLHGRVELADYSKLVTDLWQGTKQTVDSGWQVTKATGNLVQDISKAANDGGSLTLGDVDGLLGVNVIGSLLGGNKDQGTIPDSRGITGPVPVNVSFTDKGVVFGGELPVTPLLTTALAVIPFTLPYLSFLAPLNLGGIGVVGTVDKEGFTAKFYGIAGPSYDVGAAKVGANIELGTYTDVHLLSWNNKTVADLPVIGDILGKIPVIKDLGISLPTLDIHFDSKAYAQLTGGVDVLGKGPQGQIEVITDLDHALALLAGITSKTAGTALEGAGKVAGSALDGAGKVVAAVFEHDADAPIVQLIGSDSAVQEHALAA
jgi:hypothetical protein